MVGGACSSSERVQLWQLQNSRCKIVADRCVIVSDRKAHGLEIVTTGAIVDDSRVKSHEVSLQPVIADIERSSLSFLTLMFVAQYRGALGDLRPRKDPRKKPIDDFSRGRRGSGSEKVVDEPGPSTATIHTLHCLTDLRFRLARARAHYTRGNAPSSTASFLGMQTRRREKTLSEIVTFQRLERAM